MTELRHLQILRCIALLTLLVLTTAGFRYLSPLQAEWLLGLAAVEFILIAITQLWLLRSNLLMHLLLDVAVVTAILYVAGGATNPFVFYYLVPIAFASATLTIGASVIVTLACLLAYSALMKFYLPLGILSPHEDMMSGIMLHSDEQGMLMMMPDHTNVHLLGMWFSFGFSALLITWFVTRMAVTIKQRDAELASMREQRLRDEQLLGIATLAASTVHELGTPLSTLGMVVDEMKADADGSGNKPAELATLETEIQRCRRIVQNLSTAAAQHQPDVMQQRILRDYLGDVLTHWQLLQPAIALYQNLEHAQGQVMVDATLEPALLNILNNAAEASPSGIEVACENATAQQVIISVRDYGAGFKLPAENLMQPFASTRGEGRGLGLYLTKATIERLGGKLVLSNHPQGGGLVRIYLPTRKL